MIDLASDTFFRDPMSVVATLRATAPLVEARFPLVGRVWVTTTHETAARVLKDSASFALRENGAVASLRWWMPSSVARLASGGAPGCARSSACRLRSECVDNRCAARRPQLQRIIATD
jgi:hypothetical protein